LWPNTIKNMFYLSLFRCLSFTHTRGFFYNPFLHGGRALRGLLQSVWCEFLDISRLRWCWVFLKRTPILSGIQFTTHFIETVVVETKRFVGSFVNMILTWQTCGQRSSRAAESKRWALGNDFSERICYMFLISNVEETEILVCAQLRYLRFGEPQLNVKIRFFLRRNTFFNRKSPLRIGSPNANNKVVHRPRSQSPLTFCIKEHIANSLGKIIS